MYTATFLKYCCRNVLNQSIFSTRGHALKTGMNCSYLVPTIISASIDHRFESTVICACGNITDQCLASGDHNMTFPAYARTVKWGVVKPSFSSWLVHAINGMRRLPALSCYMYSFLFSSTLIPHCKPTLS